MPQKQNVHTSDQDLPENRRLFVRMPIRLKAKIKSVDAKVWQSTVLNCCTGGLLLSLEASHADISTLSNRPIKGDVVDIECQVRIRQKAHIMHFNAIVTWAHEQRLGVKYVEPDLNNLHIMQRLAVSYQEKHPSVPQQTQQDLPLINRSLIMACNEVFEGVVQSIMARFNEEIPEILTNLASLANDIRDHNVYFESLDIIKSVGKELQDTYRQETMQALADYTPDKLLVFESKDSTANRGLVTLSLVEDEEFDEWLADTVLVDRIENEYRSEISALEKRLSVIWAGKINKDNNIFGPQIFSFYFQKVIKSIDLKHNINVRCFKSFENILFDIIGVFYTKLNELLISKDILPIIQHEVKIQPECRGKEKSSEEKIKEPEKTLPLQAKEDTADITSSDSVIAQKPKPVNIEPVENSPVADGDTTASTENSADLYSLVSELKSLQNQLSHYRSADQTGHIANSFPASPPQADVSQAPVPSSPEDLVAAISRLQPKGDGAAITASINPEKFKNRIIEKLKSGKTGDSNLGIGKRENRIIDVSSHIFHSMLQDKLVALNIRPWLKRLEIPVLKTAITDDSLYLDRSHSVRRVVNKIATLELLTQGNNEKEQLVVNRAIDWLVNLINDEHNNDSGVFLRAEKQLDLLIDVQNNTYNNNIKNVIRFAKLEENGTPLPANSITSKATHVENSQDEALLPWITKVKRLKEGTWLLFNAKISDGQRLRLAWVAPKSQRHIFVNVSGKKERVLEANVLARRLRSGEVVVLDNANEPALDRAQFKMLEELHAKLRHQLLHDPLTDLLNRREFEAQLSKYVSRSEHVAQTGTLLFVKVDNFRATVTSCGYDGSDKLLVEVAAQLSSGNLENQVGRLGADEFAILLRDRSLEETLDYAEGIIKHVSNQKLVWKEISHLVSISVGVATLSSGWADASSLIQATKSSCELANELGGNQLQLYHKANEKLSRRNKIAQWVADIDSVLNRGALRLRCQKIMSIQAHEDKHEFYEILLSAKNEQGEELPIQEFIEVAESYNRIIEIDRWVIVNTFNWIADHLDIVENISGFAINLSGVSLNDETLIDFIEHQIESTGIPTNKVCFEVTETAGITNLSDAAEFIENIKNTGCKFALDDFGSGMSSYAYLKNLPIDYLKIDGAFVKDLVNNPADRAIVKSISEIGHFMGKKIVAEHVENNEILQILTEMGVDYGQGYGIEKPIWLDSLI
ncbi:MAG: DUF1631 family protein [Thiohalomonadales bacterium]